jgi:hypothetical protein
MKELNEMTAGRTDEPKNPFCTAAFEAVSLLGMDRGPHLDQRTWRRVETAGHMIAIDPPVSLLTFSLASKGPSTHEPRLKTQTEAFAIIGQRATQKVDEMKTLVHPR